MVLYLILPSLYFFLHHLYSFQHSRPVFVVQILFVLCCFVVVFRHWVCWLCSQGDKRVDNAHLHSVTHAKRVRGDASDYSAEERVVYHHDLAEG